ncbi:MAG: hypothetical protein F6J98_17450, partial [Moorea sp. SIO4G2]|nr:hypothetical protein [Moorena sp. SIO4G2]
MAIIILMRYTDFCPTPYSLLPTPYSLLPTPYPLLVTTSVNLELLSTYIEDAELSPL